MSRLALFLLGPPRIERDGQSINVDTRKAIALLAYLAVTGQAHSRDTLAALLWPDYDQSSARATLRRTLSALNKALAGDWLEISREVVSLRQVPGLWVDLTQFRQFLAECSAHGHAPSEVCPACLKALESAVDLYRDDFLAGFALRDSQPFDEWQFFQSESFRRELSTALQRLVSCHIVLQQFETATEFARRWLSMDPLHEPAHRQLMLLYAWAGRRSAALHQYRECTQVLEQELGVAPLEETTQLYEAIKENRAPTPPAGQAWTGETGQAAEAQLATQPIIAESTGPDVRAADSSVLRPNKAQNQLAGRDYEWSTLLNTYRSVSGEGHLAVLEGEVGIGKTRLADELISYAQGDGSVSVAARCYEGEADLAYGPVVAVLRAALDQSGAAERLEHIPAHWLSESARLLPEIGFMRPGLPSAPPLDSPGAQVRFFEGIRQTLMELCRGNRPGIVFFDDIQWADSASLDVLTYLVRRLPGWPIYLLLTWRPEQMAGDTHLLRSEQSSRAPDLRTLVAEAQRSGHATVLPLKRLDSRAVADLARSIVGDTTSLPAEVSDRLYSETEGLPFFVVEYLTAIAQGFIAGLHGDWSLPGGVRDLIRSRLASVSETGWQLLNTAAVIGRSFDFDTLRDASGRGEEETVAALEELMRQGLVTEMHGAGDTADLQYDFSHEKLRAQVYEETSLARRRLLHRRVADALAAHGHAPREDAALAGQIAQHYRLAGEERLAADFYKRAGEYARSLYASREAISHFQTALALGHPETSALHGAIGDLHTLLGEYSLAVRSYEKAAALRGDGAGDIEHKLGTVYLRRGAWERAESHLEAALRALQEQEGAHTEGGQARVLADWSLAAYRLGQSGRAAELANRALSLAEAGHDKRALAQAHNVLGILASSAGDLQAARSHLEHSLALAQALGDPGIRAAALNNLALALQAGGDSERAIALTEEALSLSVAQGDRHREAALHNNLADLLHATGRSDASMSHLKQAVAIYSEIGVEAGDVQPAIWKLAEW